MKMPRHIVDMIKLVSSFEKKSEEENVLLSLYGIFKWVEENEHRLFCMSHYDEKEKFVSFNFFFNVDGKMMVADTHDKKEFNFQITVKEDAKDLYSKLMLSLAFSEKRMKELSEDDFPDGFLGGEDDNYFF